MKRIYVAFLLFLGYTSATAQLTNSLAKALEENPNALHNVCISFPNMLDYPSLNQTFKTQNLTSAQRAKIVNRLLMAQADEYQKNALKIMAQSGEYEYIFSFYIVNKVFAKLPKQTILQLADLTEVQEISLSTGQLIFDEPIQSHGLSFKGATGPEPGLVAINAPAMWALGYTGRGRKVYVYDTGVWPTHPSFSNRFLGNYGPMQQAWYGHFIDEPNGSLSSHGTHVLGTTAGLDTTTSDTIGVAFGSYWMACDLINGSTAAGLPDQVHLIGAFEWALNPDGDTATTNDIPDVINNSWRWRDIIDTAECNGMIPQLMSAIEAAGIANIFSGGNTGPNNNGVNSPQRINLSEVNTFTVGSVDGNQTFPYPISSFSTRGPTQCAGTGSLKIHPEVVAPGQNVRSAWGTDGYNTISGTSMASPHVSGAVLLLKEAFPYLSGEVLLEALYNSSIDMGPTGEDNTYGNGLIDVYAAYQLLAQTHVPINPNQVDWDVAIKEVVYPSGDVYLCDSLFSPSIVLENLGDSTIASLVLSVYDNGNPVFGSPIPFSTPNFTAGSSYTLPTNFAFALPPGEHEWSFEVSINRIEYDLVNNTRYVRFTTPNTTGLPLLEDFESGIDATKWIIENPDYSLTWDTTAVNGWPNNAACLYLNAAFYSPNNSQKDGLLSQELAITNTGQPINLAFDLAYRSRGAIGVLQDTLAIFISEDCGQSYTELYRKYGTALSTVSNTGSFFTPVDSSEWRREYISLDSYAGKNVLLKFESVNRNGNPIFIDNISIYAGGFDPFSLAEEDFGNIELYPNPATEALMLTGKTLHEKLSFTIYNAQGQVVVSGETTGTTSRIDLAGFTKGVYFLTLKQGQKEKRLKFVKL